MARFTRIETALMMKEMGMVPVFYHPNLETCKKVVQACYEGGLRVFEFANRGDYAHELFSDLNKWAEENVPEMILGIGSVVDAPTSSLYIQLGANFVVAPLLNPEMAKTCNRRKVMWIPGCGTLSEISHAEELGAEVIKIFPGSCMGGASFVKSIKGPSSWTSLMPSGGVTTKEDNLKSWFDAGVYCVGLGSGLLTKALVEAEDHAPLTALVKKTLATIKAVR